MYAAFSFLLGTSGILGIENLFFLSVDLSIHVLFCFLFFCGSVVTYWFPGGSRRSPVGELALAKSCAFHSAHVSE